MNERVCMQGLPHCVSDAQFQAVLQAKEDKKKEKEEKLKYKQKWEAKAEAKSSINRKKKLGNG